MCNKIYQQNKKLKTHPLFFVLKFQKKKILKKLHRMSDEQQQSRKSPIEISSHLFPQISNKIITFYISTFVARHFISHFKQARSRNSRNSEIFLNEIMEINVIIIIEMGFFSRCLGCCLFISLTHKRKLHY